MIPEYIKTKEQYDEWFNSEVDKALHAPLSTKTLDQLKREYNEKFSFRDNG